MPRPVAPPPRRGLRTTGRGGTPLSPHDDRTFGELTEPFRHCAAHRHRPRPALRGPARPRPHHRFAWLAPAAAAGILAAGVVLAHGLLLASGLVLAGLLGQRAAYGRDRQR
ncbi:hypothetical protein [Streptomyces platensis]|uniref:hypothetical protein n=1 Tax=Streptomyces platensis TaxID=58346 RepID=UPI0037B5D37A